MEVNQMTPTEKAIRDYCGQHADWWPSTTQVQAMLALAQSKRIEELEAMLERQTARIVDLQTHIDNFDGEDR